MVTGRGDKTKPNSYANLFGRSSILASINGGVSGMTCNSAISRGDMDLLAALSDKSTHKEAHLKEALMALTLRPKAVVFMIFKNDLQLGEGTIKSNAETLIKLTRDKVADDVPIIFLGIFYSKDEGLAQRINNALYSVCSESDNVYFHDLGEQLKLRASESTAGESLQDQHDPLHLTEAGYEAVRLQIYNFINGIVAGAARTGTPSPSGDAYARSRTPQKPGGTKLVETQLQDLRQEEEAVKDKERGLQTAVHKAQRDIAAAAAEVQKREGEKAAADAAAAKAQTALAESKEKRKRCQDNKERLELEKDEEGAKRSKLSTKRQELEDILKKLEELKKQKQTLLEQAGNI